LLTASEIEHLRVVLVAARNPLNIGAAARAMSNFGFLHLRVVNPYHIAFREARSAVGASKLLTTAQEFPTLADAVADCTLVVGTTSGARRELQHALLRLEAGARRIRRRVATGRVALLFGSEKFGLSNLDLSHCHWLMRIPTREQHASMNLGQAVSVCLYELVRATPREMPTSKKELATAGEVERITRLLLDVLRDSGFIERHHAGTAEEKARRLVRRLHLPARDAEVWMGIFRQIEWKLRDGQKPGG
jgi:TrmH family RNA methyltransferase